jgi:hypothetical protein
MKRLKLIAVALLAAVVGGMLLHNQLYPVPNWLVGTWESENLERGVVQVTITREGVVDLAITDSPGRPVGHQWVAPTQFRVNVIGETATFWHAPTGTSQTRKYRITREGERLSSCEILTVPKGSVSTVTPKPVLWRRALTRKNHVPIMLSRDTEAGGAGFVKKGEPSATATEGRNPGL